jgi:hypothetical protein
MKVPLLGGARPSQNDLFVLARGAQGPVSIMVEGKVNESFGPMLGEWRDDASEGKESRLRFLLSTVGLSGVWSKKPRGFVFDSRIFFSGMS